MIKFAAEILLAIILAIGGIYAWQYLRPNPNALWQIVSEKCVPEFRAGADRNACAKVDLVDGYVVFKDRIGIGQYLLIPTKRIEGIESANLVEAGAHNYWRDAWQARVFVEGAVGVPLQPEDIGLAINSARGRSQNQLHIHIDCMRPDVVATLAAQKSTIAQQWRELPAPISGHRYRALLIIDGELNETNPFGLLSKYIHPLGEAMADQTLLLTATTLSNGSKGFLLLNDHAGAGDPGSAEELLDHSCAARQQHP